MIFNNGEKKANDFPKMAKKEAKINNCFFVKNHEKFEKIGKI